MDVYTYIHIDLEIQALGSFCEKGKYMDSWLPFLLALPLTFIAVCRQD